MKKKSKKMKNKKKKKKMSDKLKIDNYKIFKKLNNTIFKYKNNFM